MQYHGHYSPELSRHIQEIYAEGEKAVLDGRGRPTRALIIASEGDASFCAGADLKERAGFGPEEVRAKFMGY